MNRMDEDRGYFQQSKFFYWSPRWEYFPSIFSFLFSSLLACFPTRNRATRGLVLFSSSYDGWQHRVRVIPHLARAWDEQGSNVPGVSVSLQVVHFFVEALGDAVFRYNEMEWREI